MEELLSIGKYAEAVGLSVSAVRFYGDRGVLEPAHTDPGTGYRSYRADQIPTGRLVRDLRLIDLPLGTVAEALTMTAAERSSVVAAHIAERSAEVDRARRIAARLGAASSSAIDASGGDAVAPALREESVQVVVDAADLATAFDQVCPFARKEPDMPHLMTIQVEVGEDGLRLAATDRFRLAVRDLGFVGFRGSPCVVLISAVDAHRCVAALRSIIDDGAVDEDARATVRVGSDGAWVVVGGHTIELPAVPAEFPDYRRLFHEQAASTFVVVERRAMLDALEGFDDGTGAVLLRTEPLRIERRDVAVDLEGEVSGPACFVAVDPSFATECVSSAIGPEVVLEIEADGLRPILCRSATTGTFVSLLMPVRLE